MAYCLWSQPVLSSWRSFGLLIYAKVKPELDQCREIAYDKLAQMERSDFSMLSDTLIYDKDGKQIGLLMQAIINM